MYESILTQMYEFRVLFTFFDFYHEKYLGINWETNIFLTEICTSSKNTFI